MSAYYNEYDQKAAAWLRELIKADLIAPGEVDERSIADVKADDLRGFSQCHFFAGIGGWSRALRLAGWPDDRPVWTGSPPCQPFSNAGKRKGQDDPRHLWPVFFNLVSKCKPPAIFGEQVEAAIRTGWLDDLQDDLEAESYATGKIVLPACSVGGYHIRQRIWFVAERVADTNDARPQRHGRLEQQHDAQGWQKPAGLCAEGGEHGGLAQSDNNLDHGANQPESRQSCRADTDVCIGLAEPDCSRREPGERNNQAAGHRDTVAAESVDDRPGSADAPDSIWSAPDWLFCRDGKWRPVESGTFPLADGIPGRVGMLRGYGNAIVPQVAAEFIMAFMEVE